MSVSAAIDRLKELADPVTAKQQARYFKTGPGEYGEGDVFIGVRVPALRSLARQLSGLSVSEMVELLQSDIHEQRLLALLLLVQRYRCGSEAEQKKIFTAYLSNTRYINNWDLVDVSAEKIVGAWLYERDRSVLDKLAASRDLWRRRISIMATLYFIRQGEFRPTLKLARVLLGDQHDLIHKAVGWMLREVGNRDQEVAEVFLRRHYRVMPRTMLRYAIEKFPPALRKKYLAGQIE
ncbi:MAG: DNA alkylation repair protein [Gammaproteobacteria bacterium]|nr:DNA alkylation repair protein [Gammaproteobacteria bacterium]MDH5651739.1 DNA alkylation repair protein [Gammaproteobacteria bacterium]